MTGQNTDLYAINPANGQELFSFKATDPAQMQAQFEKAKKAQKLWAQRSLKERAIVLKRLMWTLEDKALWVAQQISAFNGKTVEEALVAEVYPTLSALKFYTSPPVYKRLRPKSLFLSALPFAKSKVLFRPLGVVGIISPWNYPFMISMQDLPAAFMAGNAVLLKPSEFSIGLGPLLKTLFEKAGFPQHLFQMVFGAAETGKALLELPLDKICFTGSTQVGKLIAAQAAKTLTPVHLELGGKDGAIVLEDADVEDTVAGITWAAMTNCGQTCASVELAFLPRSRQKEYEQAFKTYLEKVPDSNFGYLNTIPQGEKIRAQLNQAVGMGARILAQKDIAERKNHPYFVPPTIVVNVPKYADLRKEETFGPLLPLIFYDNLEEVFAELDDLPYGLTGSVWGKNPQQAWELAQGFETGVVTINDHMITPGFPEAPWQGKKLSGLGHSHMAESLEEFSNMTYIYSDRGILRYNFWRYPHEKDFTTWMRGFMGVYFSPKILTRIWSGIVYLPRLIFGKK